RHRQGHHGRRSESHAHGPRDRDARVHVARTVVGRHARQPHRHLFVRPGGVQYAHRPVAVPGGVIARGHDRPPNGTAAYARRDQGRRRMALRDPDRHGPLAGHPQDRYAHASQFGRDLVRAVAAMPLSAFSSTGTLAIAVPHPNAPTVQRPVAPAPTPSPTPAPTPPATRQVSRRPTPLIAGAPTQVDGAGAGRVVLTAFIVLAIIVGGGAAWFVFTSRIKPAPPAVTSAAATPSTTSPNGTSPAASTPNAPASPGRAAALAARDSTRHDSTPARSDSSSTKSAASMTASATVANSTTVVPTASAAAPDSSAASQAVPPPADLDSVLSPIRDNIEVGRSRMSDGEYEGARVRFAQATDQIRQLGKEYATTSQAAALRRDLSHAIDANRAACRAEKQLDERRGQTGPDCP